MRTTISVPDDVFEAAERLARHTKKSRSQLFSDAIRDYVARHAAEEIEVGRQADKFVRSASSRTLKFIEWYRRR